MTLTLRGSVTLRSSVALGNLAMAPIQATADALATSGDSVPVTGQWASAFYDAYANTSWFFYAGSPDGVARVIYVKTYNHSHTLWLPDQTSPGTFIATNPDTSSHGEPGAVMDQYGYAHVFFGAHGAPFQYSYTTKPHSSTAWTAGSPVGTSSTIANPVLCNNKIYLFTQGSNQQLTYYIGTPSPTGGASWGIENIITSFGPSFVWLGNAIAVGTKIYFAFTFAPTPDTYINDVYFAYLETADGSLHNVNNSFSVAVGSLPINRATAQTNFAVFLSPDTSHATVIPTIAFDSANRPHVMYANGVISNTTTSAGSYPLYDTYWTGSAWTAGVQIGGTAQAGYFFSLPTLVPTPTGVAAFWGQQNGALEDAYTATWTLGGGWTAATKILAAYQWPISNYTPVTNAVGQARVQFAEAAPVLTPVYAASLFGTLAVWAYGDNGFLTVPWGNPSGMIAHWQFDAATTNFGANTTSDTSGNNVTGTLSNMTSANQVTGRIAEALTMVGSGTNAISFGNNATIKPALPITLMVWYKPTALEAAYNMLLETDSNPTVYAGLYMDVSNLGSLEAYYGDGLGSTSTHFRGHAAISAAPLMTAGAFAHCSTVYTASSVTSYINGQFVAVSNVGSAPAVGYTSSPSAIQKLAGTGAVYGPLNGPNGVIDDMRMYNRALAPWEISQIMWQGIQGHL